MLSQEVFGDLKYARALTSVANLDWGNHADSRDIPEKYLLEGCEVVLGVMQQSRPRVVITLVRRTWDVFASFITHHARVLDYTSVTVVDCRLVRLPGLAHDTLVARSPQQPVTSLLHERACSSAPQ